MKKMENEIELLDTQDAAMRAVFVDMFKQTLFQGGVGAGKSFFLSTAFLNFVEQRPWAENLIGIPTWTAGIPVIKAITAFCNQFGIDAKFLKNPSDPRIVTTFDGIKTEHYIRTAEQGAVAFNCNNGLFDECFMLNFDGFMEFVGRLGRLPGTLGQIVMTGTPRGKCKMAQYVREQEEKNSETVRNMARFKASTLSNYHLGNEFRDNIRRRIHGNLARQEIDGEEIEMGDIVFPYVPVIEYEFSRYKPWFLAIDYGYNFPAFVLFQEIRKNRFVAFRGFFPEKIQIQDALRVLDKIMLHEYGTMTPPEWICYDPAGRQHSDKVSITSAQSVMRHYQGKPKEIWSFSDYDRSIQGGILELDSAFRGGFLSISESETITRKHEESPILELRKVREYTNLHESVSGITWDDRTKSVYVKGGMQYDHPVDCLRYPTMCVFRKKWKEEVFDE